MNRNVAGRPGARTECWSRLQVHKSMSGTQTPTCMMQSDNCRLCLCEKVVRQCCRHQFCRCLFVVFTQQLGGPSNRSRNSSRVESLRPPGSQELCCWLACDHFVQKCASLARKMIEFLSAAVTLKQALTDLYLQGTAITISRFSRSCILRLGSMENASWFDNILHLSTTLPVVIFHSNFRCHLSVTPQSPRSMSPTWNGHRLSDITTSGCM